MSDSFAGVAESFRTGARLLFAAAAFGLAACGSGGSPSSAVPPPAPSSAPQATAGNLLIPQAGGSATLPDAGGITSTIELSPLSDGSVATSATASTSITLPPGGSGDLTTQSVTVPKTPIWYLAFVPFATVTFTHYPGFTIGLPPNVTTTGKQFFIGLYDGSTHTWIYPFEGPATVHGRLLTFAPAASPITFKRGYLYIFELYSQPATSPIVTTPSSLTLKPGDAKTFTISETGYTGPFTVGTCKSGSTTIATVAATGAQGPSATVTVTGVVNGTCSIAISDSYGQTASENITVNLPALVVNPSTLTINGNTPGSFTVSETGYTGTFSIGTCTQSSVTIATASPTTANGPSANITVTPAKAGSCTLAVSDTNGQTTDVSVTVNTSSLQISPTALQFVTAPSAQTQSVTISEANYTGTFSYTPCNQNATTVATLTPASISGPSATLTVASQAVGNCTVMVTDSLGQSASFTVGVTAASFTVN